MVYHLISVLLFIWFIILRDLFNSFRLWQRVSEAIVAGDIQAATNEKFLLEEEQRKLTRERKVKMKEWEPRLFDRNMITGDWVYKYAE